ncbi:uncharacterized protein LOC112347819 isoform X2 [Selaginella moellendorffii]|uniref:uncharacterized protein LOC112347819 isoform X2 n=1 Tax=Selaginella moellendorffii TaxID=88036 RepID=UPI000D1CC94C|nr:uncharacterized protein LOC112347819 isoform X2 [Selaginella moellendorffii]|eukprot:XP_024535061.1 uncharacterized protein LOC112347819 isoform X2 [Selaginella moellendorffii]
MRRSRPRARDRSLFRSLRVRKVYTMIPGEPGRGFRVARDKRRERQKELMLGDTRDWRNYEFLSWKSATSFVSALHLERSAFSCINLMRTVQDIARFIGVLTTR